MINRLNSAQAATDYQSNLQLKPAAIDEKSISLTFSSLPEILFLIESKHTNNAKLPSVGDIKDGLLKMMLYANLENVRIDNELMKSQPVLRLTSRKLAGMIFSDNDPETHSEFFKSNNLSLKQKEFLGNLFAEARANNFIVSLGNI